MIFSPRTSIAQVEKGNDAAVRADHFGVLASGLCAVHCAAAPFLFLLSPVFGSVWAHPASHWCIALLVVPFAGIMVLRGFRRHRLKWVVISGSIGVFLVLVGAGLPYLESGKNLTCRFTIPLFATGPSPAVTIADACCPSSVSNSVGSQTVLQIPPATTVTTLGGIALIIAHLGNLRACRRHT